MLLITNYMYIQILQIVFNPKQAGVYVAHVQLLANPVVSEQPLSEIQIPTMVTLQGIAERPSVQVSSKFQFVALHHSYLLS